MGSGRRCGCWALSELDIERSRHQIAIEENMRYQKLIQDLRDELLALHGTVADLEKRYSELSTRYRGAVQSLEEMNSKSDRLKEHSTEVADENRRLRNSLDRQKDEIRALREELAGAKQQADEERLQRVESEGHLQHDMLAAQRTLRAQLRRAASLHEMDTNHLRQDVSRLQQQLEREKHRHNLTKRNLHHTATHHLLYQHPLHHMPYCDCPECYL
ncbi:uncharacterized protein LOC143029608 [Oratosquilla oratoria]|uniref:uncharacterized protein LOC143029608 n=1 Tax=Oratosquilla oratoria TaxID=337810 RepID=UPI003F76387C